MGIKQFTLLALLLIIIGTIVVLWEEKEELPTFPEKLEEAIRYGRMKTYHQPYYDYEVRYPAFFEQVPDSLIDGEGTCLFRCGNVELSAQVIPNSDSLSVQNGMQYFATLHHAEQQQSDSQSFILSGQLYMNDSPIPNYRFYAKYVCHRKFWFVQTLTYPDNCTKAVERLVQQINNWTVWENHI